MAKEQAATSSETQSTPVFVFTKENQDKAQGFINKYPEGKQASAMLPLLDLAQRQSGGWLPKEAMDFVANLLDVSPIRVYEVASFYTMFNLKPVGKFLIQVCRTTPCWLRGADDLTQLCKDHLGISKGETTEDKNFTLMEVECLGACCNAPVVQINDEYYEDLDSESMRKLLDDLKADKEVKIGSQKGRNCSAPTGELTTLQEVGGKNAAG